MEQEFRQALESIVRRFEASDTGGLTTRPGLAWAMYQDAKAALAAQASSDPAYPDIYTDICPDSLRDEIIVAVKEWANHGAPVGNIMKAYKKYERAVATPDTAPMGASEGRHE